MMFMENNDIKKIGRNTFGITFIIVGIAIILQLFIKYDIFKYAMLMWPVVLILLGIEILYYSHKKDITIKYDGIGIFLTFLVIIFGSIFSIVNLGIMRLTESKFLFNRPLEYSYAKYFNVEEIELKIMNLSEDNINVVVKEEKGLDMTRVDIKIESKDEKISNLRELFDDNSIYEFITVNSYNDNSIEIYNYPDWVKKVSITVYTPNKEKVKCTGSINLKD